MSLDYVYYVRHVVFGKIWNRQVILTMRQHIRYRTFRLFFSLRNISSLKVFIFELNDVLLGSIVCNCTCRVKETLFVLYEQVKLTWVSYFNFIYNLNLFTYLVLDLNQSRIINLLSYTILMFNSP